MLYHHFDHLKLHIIKNSHQLDLSTSFNIALEVLDESVMGENTGSVEVNGDDGINKCWSSREALSSTWRGAVKGLKTGLWCLWTSLAISSAGNFIVCLGDDSVSKNLTNSSEKDWK